MSPLSLRFLCFYLLLVPIVAGPVLAAGSADSNDDPTAVPPDEIFDEEITVNGQQQQRTLQETVESVDVTTGRELESRSTVDLYELVALTANVSQSFGYKGFSIRGIDQRGFGGGGGQLVTVLVDGASLQNNQASFFGPYSAWDLGQVEIFRGPQSTQQGRNALAGAIVIRSADPTYELDFKGRLSAGNLGSRQMSAAANVPLVENKVALRVSVDQRDFDGWVENPTRGEDDYDFRQALTARAKLRFDVNDRFSGMLLLSHTDSSGGEDVIDQNRFPENRFNVSDAPAEEGSIHEITTLELSYLLSDRWSLQSTTNVYDHEYLRTEDSDMTAAPGNTLRVDQMDRGFSQQLRFLYAGEGGKQGVLGLYYADLEDDRLSEATLPGPLLGLPAFVTVTGSLSNQVQTENLALFGEIDLPFGDKWTLTAGARLDDERKVDFSNQVFLIDPPVVNLPAEPSLTLESDYQAFLPKLGLTYDFSDNVAAGLSVQRGYRAGGRSQSLVSLTVSDFDPELTNNFEVFLRTLSPRRGLRFNLNAFYVDWQDQQVNVRTDLDLEIDVVTVNAGSSELYGLEALLDYQANKDLLLSASLGLVSTRFNELSDGDQDFSGNEFPFSPDTSLSLGVRWSLNERWSLSADAAYQSSFFSDQDNALAFKVDSHALVNAKLTYDLGDWAVSAFARNLFNEDYLLQAFPTGARSGEPRVYGLEVSFGL